MQSANLEANKEVNSNGAFQGVLGVALGAGAIAGTAFLGKKTFDIGKKLGKEGLDVVKSKSKKGLDTAKDIVSKDNVVSDISNKAKDVEKTVDKPISTVVDASDITGNSKHSSFNPNDNTVNSKKNVEIRKKKLEKRRQNSNSPKTEPQYTMSEGEIEPLYRMGDGITEPSYKIVYDE